MKISYQWIRELLPFDLPADQMADILTNTGLEVEGVEDFISVEGGLEGLVIGEVVEKQQHPNADRLSLTKVDVGSGEPLSIVCGAPNVAAKQKVVVATVGAMLYPMTGEPFKIKKGKIRGEVSEGMICAEDEIGLGEGHDGIMVLDADAQIGMPAADYFSIYRDKTIEIGLTPNRTDAISHFGVARDLRAALIHAEDLRHENVPELRLNTVHLNERATRDSPLKIRVEDPSACPRYAGLVIEGITVGPSPDWLQNRLKAIGLTPKNNVVDITNYVMHELGQPLHAFDMNQIEGNEVVIRFAKAKEVLVTLDEVERELSEEDLLICDANKGMCIAGVFGGVNSGITTQSTAVFLESAVFNAVSIRKTSKRHLLHTDAAYRFERGVDPEMTIPAIQRAANLILELAGGRLTSPVMDHYPVKETRADIVVNLDRMAKLIGKEIPRPRILALLREMDFEILEQNERELRLTAPLYRRDVTREADVVEEILRIYGYNNIEMPERLHSTLSYAPSPDPEALMHKVADALVARGFHETMSNSLTKLAYAEMIGQDDHSAATAVRVRNPLSSDLGQLRQSLVFQGLEALERNFNFRQKDLAFFEFGRTYHRLDNGILETPYLALWMTGRRLPESWNNTEGRGDFYALHADLSAALNRIGVSFAAHPAAEAHPYYSQHLVLTDMNGNALGTAGLLHPDLLSAFDLDQQVSYAQLEWERLVKLAGKHSVSYAEPAKYPSVRRDLSLLLESGTDFARIQEVAFATERKLLKEVTLFDVYEGKNIEAGKKSYAMAFTLEDPAATLTDKKIDKAMQRILQALQEALGAQLRS